MSTCAKNNPLAEDLDHILVHTHGQWEELRGKRIFITGGTGFFGCWLLESFLWANDKLGLNSHATVLTRSPDSFRAKAPHLAEHPAVTIIEGTTNNFDFPAGAFSHVIHAATETTPGFEPVMPLVQFESNIAGTRRVLDFACTSGVSKVLFTSSGAVYGRQPPELSHITEHFTGAPEPTDLTASYGHSKRAEEFLCAAYAHQYGFNALIARCFAFVGPWLPLTANLAIGNFINDAMQHRTIRISGDGTPYRSYLYASDLVIWLWTILFRGQSCRPYNVGAGVNISIAELARTVRDIVSPQTAVEVAGRPVPGKPAERYVPSVERCEMELGLQVRVPLDEAILRTSSWYQQQTKR